MGRRVQQWGDSLAVRIPTSLALRAGLQKNGPIALSLIDGKLLIEPIVAGGFALDQFLAGVTDQNVQGEVATGPAVGKEVW